MGKARAPQCSQPGLHGRQVAASPDLSPTFLPPPHPSDASKHTHLLASEVRSRAESANSASPEAPLPQLGPAGVLLPCPWGPPSEERGSGSNLI